MTFLIQGASKYISCLGQTLARSFSARDGVLVSWHSLMHVFLLPINLGLQSLITSPVSDIFHGVHLCLAAAVLLHSKSVWGQAGPSWAGILSVWALLGEMSIVSFYASLPWALSKHLHFRHTFRKALRRDANSAVQPNCELLPPAVPFSSSERLNADALKMLSLTLWERVNLTGLMTLESWQKTQEGGWTLVSPYFN